ncbi:hypothetical protein C9374_000247 [Naegleria lovaniensis]|uniref:Zn(2)-C6 fungal-type domain-containing protein n=1 Tax=Naegleria lovaniensis TaxID=51637 RepID=A0AA88KNW1_NAELO|nr:uncharacterized protein C9374_000247 [Naegleria lovaniensis]KAG2388808.1 hypothetical protein C9374_000247 [Naegleria lovaniensis]
MTTSNSNSPKQESEQGSKNNLQEDFSPTNISSYSFTTNSTNTTTSSNDESQLMSDANTSCLTPTTNSSTTKKKRRSHSKKAACTNCHKAHARCDEGRPCARCIRLGLQCIEPMKRKTTREERAQLVEEHRRLTTSMKLLPRPSSSTTRSNASLSPPSVSSSFTPTLAANHSCDIQRSTGDIHAMHSSSVPTSVLSLGGSAPSSSSSSVLTMLHASCFQNNPPPQYHQHGNAPQPVSMFCSNLDATGMRGVSSIHSTIGLFHPHVRGHHQQQQQQQQTTQHREVHPARLFSNNSTANPSMNEQMRQSMDEHSPAVVVSQYPLLVETTSTPTQNSSDNVVSASPSVIGNPQLNIANQINTFPYMSNAGDTISQTMSLLSLLQRVSTPLSSFSTQNQQQQPQQQSTPLSSYPSNTSSLNDHPISTLEQLLLQLQTMLLSQQQPFMQNLFMQQQQPSRQQQAPDPFPPQQMLSLLLHQPSVSTVELLNTLSSPSIGVVSERNLPNSHSVYSSSSLPLNPNSFLNTLTVPSSTTTTSLEYDPSPNFVCSSSQPPNTSSSTYLYEESSKQSSSSEQTDPYSSQLENKKSSSQ